MSLLRDFTVMILDIDECAAGACDANANCTDTEGSYFCICRTGYTGDGDTCDGRFLN